MQQDTTASTRAGIDPFLRLPDVEAATGLRKSTIYALQKRGEFPRCVQITPRCVAWSSAAVRAWMQARIDGAASKQANDGGAQ